MSAAPTHFFTLITKKDSGTAGAEQKVTYNGITDNPYDALCLYVPNY